MSKHTRRFLVAGNWKMNLGLKESLSLAKATLEVANNTPSVDVGIIPGMLELDRIHQALESVENHFIAAQNCCHEAKGAFTGEVSLDQLGEIGVKHVLLGHSERRHIFGESDLIIAQKANAALEAGFHVIFCVGETLKERRSEAAKSRVKAQLDVLKKVPVAARNRVTIAYEPVWAIGTGETATPDVAQEMHGFIRDHLKTRGDYEQTRILYGGSVKASDAKELAAQPDVEGFLVGGASLDAAEFGQIVSILSKFA